MEITIQTEGLHLSPDDPEKRKKKKYLNDPIIILQYEVT